MANYKDVNLFWDTGKSRYDGLQVSLHRNVGILNLMANYTWSKSYGVNSNSAALPDNGMDKYWGVSSSDRPHTVNLVYTINVPKVKTSNTILRGAANGWQISGVTSINSSANMTSNAGTNMNFSYDNTTAADGKTVLALHNNTAYLGTDAVTIYPTIACNPNTHRSVTWVDGNGNKQKGIQYLKPECFKATESGYGNTHLGYFAGPMYWNSDLGISKNFKVGEGRDLSFKLQAFNFLNHPLWSFAGGDSALHVNFDGTGVLKNSARFNNGTTSTVVNNPFGVATHKYGKRVVQAEMRFTF
jgi:hypothetical protein